MGPVTVPSNYAYSVTPAAGSSDWLWWFYLGDGPSTYQWTAYSTLQGNDPNLFNPGTPTVVGNNAIPIAPVYVYDSAIQEDLLQISVLTGANNGVNYHLKQYQSTTGTWTAPSIGSSGVYLWGITSDMTSGALWGWNLAGTVYTNDASGGLSGIYFPGYVSNSVAAASPSNLLSTTFSGNCTGGTPSGHCIDNYSGTVPSGSWVSFGGGAYQLAFDSAPLCAPTSCPSPTAYALDAAGGNVGNVWYYDGYPLYSWERITSTACSGYSGGGTHQFAEIAVKDSVVFALGEYGTVWVYGSPAYTASCWTKIPNPSGETFVSIATDNGSNNSVWATDTSGNIWTMN